MIYYGKQNVDEEDIKIVDKVLKSDFLTQGPFINKFEQKVAGYCGAKYAVAVTNATSALHIACKAAGLGQGDILWTSPNTFTASANCGRYCGAAVDFVDINKRTYNMSIDKLNEKLQQSPIKPKIVVPVHFAGQSCQMDKIYNLAQKYNFIIIEDASHAIGGSYKNTKVGSCKYSDMTVFSFHPVKIITTGEGGMVLTNNEKLYNKLLLYRTHGITRNPEYMTEKADGPWYYEQIELGYNYRMTDMQAALGYSQMNRIEKFTKRRRELAEQYNELLKGLPLALPYQSPETVSSWHIYVVRIKFNKVKINKTELFSNMRQKGIALNVHYIPVHTQPYYRNLGFDWGNFPNSEQYYEEAVTLPLYYTLTDEEQKYIIESLSECLCAK
ncbi:UDP-4-amino-4,6-dideoxy-N-acetyl-beta-L-altrosamine transaminase [Pectinatus frisingensis]|uniref:UDP-4-amino-4, 6-dideoxy-N-acetyl-beta-L-altrosamine transaminase n=1 Tax=Pectinatus frisingensis TaxID=865 RepID=UPI0018C5C03A|nr:UDP-4-amino-4,6-dideoxy-N-acetyl-beta-L-altrosamine transaminase [Pectinatus frisingensis]